MVSATTPIAGTAVTSVRSLKLTVSSFVTTSTVASTGRFNVAMGFIAALVTGTTTDTDADIGSEPGPDTESEPDTGAEAGDR